MPPALAPLCGSVRAAAVEGFGPASSRGILFFIQFLFFHKNNVTLNSRRRVRAEAAGMHVAACLRIPRLILRELDRVLAMHADHAQVASSRWWLCVRQMAARASSFSTKSPLQSGKQYLMPLCTRGPQLHAGAGLNMARTFLGVVPGQQRRGT